MKSKTIIVIGMMGALSTTNAHALFGTLLSGAGLVSNVVSGISANKVLKSLPSAMTKLLSTNKDSLSELKKLNDFMNSDESMGDFLPLDFSPGWDKGANALTKNYQSMGLDELLLKQDDRYGMQSKLTVYPPATRSQKVKKAVFDDANETYQASLAVSKRSLADSGNEIKTLNQLAEKIAKTKTQKDAMDLNSRLQAEVAKQLIDLKRLNSMAVQTQAIQGQAGVTDISLDSDFLIGDIS